MADKKLGRPRVWDNDAERVAASRVREIHPDWNNVQIKAYLTAIDEINREKIKEDYDRISSDRADAIDKKRSLDPRYEDDKIIKVSLRELIDVFRNPTGYVSPLSDIDWINYYLGSTLLLNKNGTPGTCTPVQIEMSNHLDAFIMAAIDIWRGAGKTVIGLGKFNRRMCDNLNIKLALITEEFTRSVQRVSVIKQQLQTNPRIIRDYGYLPHDKAYKGYRGKWTTSMLQVKRDVIAQEPTLIGLSQGSTAMLGYHFDGVLSDDPWSEELQAQRGALEKWMIWFQGTFLGCVEKGAFIWMLFTRKGVDDLYQDIIYEKGMFNPLRRPAIVKYPSKYEYIVDSYGKPIFNQELGVPKVNIISKDGQIYDAGHGRFSMAYLLGKKKLAGNLKFEQEFQCNPMPIEGALLNWDLLQFYNLDDKKLPFPEDPEEFWDQIRWTAFMDQAFGTSDRADFSVITVVGEYGGRYYFDWIYRGKWNTNQKKRYLTECYKKYRPGQYGIESGLIQTTIARELIRALPELGLKEIHPGGQGREYRLAQGSQKEYESKIYRIYDQVNPPLERKVIYVNAKMPHFDQFEKEFRFLGSSAHDDIMDAFGQTIEMIDREGINLFFMTGRGNSYRFESQF